MNKDILIHGQIVTVTSVLPWMRGPLDAIVINRINSFGRKIFYLQPIEDSHPGAAITYAEIISIKYRS